MNGQRWLQAFRRNLGIPGLHLSTDRLDSCQHRVRRFPGANLDARIKGISDKRCFYCSPLYRGRHNRDVATGRAPAECMRISRRPDPSESNLTRGAK